MRDDDFDDLTDEEDENITDDCPHCGAAVYHDAEQCPSCGKYLSREDAPTRLPPLWILIGAGLCLVIVLGWSIGGC